MTFPALFLDLGWVQALFARWELKNPCLKNPHNDLKHRSEKPASPLIPLEETSACGGAMWRREEWERLFAMLNILNSYAYYVLYLFSRGGGSFQVRKESPPIPISVLELVRQHALSGMMRRTK